MIDGPRLVLFDCDGTLVDSQFAIVEAMTVAFQSHDLVPPKAADVRRLVGLPLGEVIARLAPEDGPLLSMVEIYKQTFRENRLAGRFEEPLFPGVREALEALTGAGCVLGVATGKSRRGLDSVLDRHDLAGFFVTLQTADDGPGKPSPHMVQRALRETGADRWNTVVVGDTAFDMLMAKAAGAGAVGVTWGYHVATDLLDAGADRLTDTFAAVPVAVGELMGKVDHCASVG